VIDVRVQAADFEPGRQLDRLEALGVAAVASLVARADLSDDVTELWIDHYPPLARSELARIATEAEARWPLPGIILIHRHGRVGAGERLAFAAAASSDPAASLEACAFLLEALRTRAPFWRKEILADGSARWR
jgi:molybdopterin synthase catalytic subunit